MSLKVVAEFDNHALASLLASTLARADFHPAAVAESPHVELAGVYRVFRVEVPAEECDAVVKFMDDNGYGKHVVRE
ncbi:MAG: hypothetical protein ACYSX0_22345 [Planctomycetota bacterium]|jgi:hypothetical protein